MAADTDAATDADDAEDERPGKSNVWIYDQDYVRLDAVGHRVMQQRFLRTGSARRATPADAVQALLDEDEELRERITELEDEIQRLRDRIEHDEASTSPGLFEAHLEQGHQPGPDRDEPPEREGGSRGARLV